MDNQVLPPTVKSRSKKFAIFDFDGTLVRPKEGRRFPKDKDDWEWLRASVPSKLKQYAKDKYRLIIVTDQSKLWKIEMIQNVVATIKLPITVLIGMKKDEQKPNPVFFQSIFKEFDKEHSFFVGDAAGRVGDWADRDIRFAENIQVPFYTPEQIFESPRVEFPNIPIPKHKEVVIMIGYPGSGKSTLVHEQFTPHGYYRVDGDVFKTGKAMVLEAENHLDQSIVFDATNGTQQRRSEYIQFAKKHGYNVRCIWVTTPIEIALERVKEREQRTGIKIPPIALYTYRKKFEKPTADECEVVIL